jgi:hypothetical protein
MANQVPIKPQLVNLAGKRIVEASRENSNAWPGVLALLSYRSTLNKEAPPSLPRVACIGVEGGVTGIVAHINGSHILNCSQELDHIEWRNVVFENATVIYHGGPTILDHVQFKNCQFSLDYKPPSQQLGQSLLASNNVSITLPSL